MSRSFMKVSFILPFVLAAASNTSAQTQPNASDTDKAFVAKASQIGIYELAISKYALDQADSGDVKDLAWLEARDHERINQELKTLSTAKNIPIPSTLNPEFQDRFNRLKASSGRDFDIAYLKDMAILHSQQQELFALEATSSGDDAFKTFAAKTNLILKRHGNALDNAAPGN